MNVLILNRINNVYIDCVYIYIYIVRMQYLAIQNAIKFPDLLGQGKEICFEETEILREILGIAVIPGKKLCLKCKSICMEYLKIIRIYNKYQIVIQWIPLNVGSRIMWTFYQGRILYMCTILLRIIWAAT